jgi:hypothetical protein
MLFLYNILIKLPCSYLGYQNSIALNPLFAKGIESERQNSKNPDMTDSNIINTGQSITRGN